MTLGGCGLLHWTHTVCVVVFKSAFEEVKRNVTDTGNIPVPFTPDNFPYSLIPNTHHYSTLTNTTVRQKITPQCIHVY